MLSVLSSDRVRRALVGGAFALSVVGGGIAQARGVEDCQLAWGQAVRSYLTQNRTKGPEDQSFRPACEIEASGDKPKARIEAVLIGARALARLDPKGCKRFMEVYVQSKEPEKVCTEAGGDDSEGLRRLITDSMPPPPAPKPKKL